MTNHTDTRHRTDDELPPTPQEMNALRERFDKLLTKKFPKLVLREHNPDNANPAEPR